MAHNIEREKETEGERVVGERCIAPGWHVLNASPARQRHEIHGVKL